MKELEILSVVKAEHVSPGRRYVTVDPLGQFALVGPLKDGIGYEHTWIQDDMTGVIVGDIVVVESKPYNATVLGVIK